MAGYDERSSSGDNSTYKKKSGSMKPRNYDPKNGSAGGGGGKPKVAKMYKPVGKNTPSAPGK